MYREPGCCERVIADIRVHREVARVKESSSSRETVMQKEVAFGNMGGTANFRPIAGAFFIE